MPYWSRREAGVMKKAREDVKKSQVRRHGVKLGQPCPSLGEGLLLALQDLGHR